MNMALADRASRTSPDDVRIPCPVCGQQIHPVAGRCKYCKTDLVKLREQRGVRAARIDPGLIGAAAAAPAPVPTPFGAPAAPFGAPAAMPAATIVQTAPVSLPDVPPSGGLLRRWPIFVAILAGIAILVCAYLLLFDKGSDAAAAKKDLGPAPDRDTQVDPPAFPPTTHSPGTAPPSNGGLADPWNQGNGAQPPPALPPTFDTPPSGGGTVPIVPPSAAPGGVPKAEDFYPVMQQSICKMMTACLGGQLGGSSAQDLCTSLMDPSQQDVQRQMVQQGRCDYDQAKAKRCLDTIAAMKCTGGSFDISKLMSAGSSVMDCAEALTCH